MVINKLISNLDSSTDALTCVYVRVLLHVRLLVEPFTAKVARIRSGVAVNQEVGRQRGTSLETFATFLAFKQLLCTVYCPEENIMLIEGNFMTYQLVFG